RERRARAHREHERVHVHPAAQPPSPGQSPQRRPRHHRGAERSLPGRGRHRPLRRPIRPRSRGARVSTAWRHRDLLLELVKREFTGRYRGSFGGLAWSFAQPLFLLAVYTVAFGVILRMRWGFPGGTGDYALMVFAGL